ncbi:ribosomal-protein-alanine N-acetyltransferase [Actinoplanes octamycinicus]|uniref:Ribosomal-protein-alanine N-acetyltransferase n=1 Tax=Actinoplanes octamycinicus TaxID=135948 RepID=A0A7W7H347_9ACTN|nr:GNAT family N-acetyltransferase [Actinoplanes octamycinicus]MBB4743094.1 ribosomal-protein-alanine N-acetyltransferase [Actinoplanes octamycinicus]GIE61344.1 alanine acetyltransferase [Actinoplanes octamycinicus]
MSELKRLAADHAEAVLAFEVANRAWFATSISDRGDDFFAGFPEHHRASLAEQAAGTCAFYLLVAEDGAVLGRFNLYNIDGEGADLGYRVAQRVAGRGVATAAVRELCGLAATDHGLRALRAAAADRNVASQRVLIKAGFVPAGPVFVGGRRGTRFERQLSPT